MQLIVPGSFLGTGIGRGVLGGEGRASKTSRQKLEEENMCAIE
jgi:hypothetical protein